MEKITRSKTPDWLTEKWQEWGEKWQSKYESTQKSNDFRWYRHKNQGYDELVKELSKMTQHHCSFCDAYHKVKRIPHTIEHFKPKTKFPLLAYQWENLFLCCGICQKKGDDFDEDLGMCMK
jgi:5-methylcytosine-specific restriction endonuclease McrA